ncbi:MAG: NAD(P)-dependent alcohol dehydrogenase [Oscillospiraceae bacterium]|nr:NAD(P)-dependent alcohol dehydrogenase [Oscillospiraceae bacterium]
MTGLKKMETREIPMPLLKEKQVLVKLEYVGICGSDIHYFEKGRIGDFVVKGDFILGHECAGVICEVGEGVTSLKKGDRVALEPGCTCGQCEFCKTGLYNLCPDVEFLATPPYHGCLQEYLAFPEGMCFKLPENMSTKEGALVEPLAVGIHAAKQGGLTLGSSVVILGSGCIGLVTLLACKAFGATDITVVDIIPKRLEYAEKLGATRIINASLTDACEEISKITGGRGADIVIETAGSVKTVVQTSYMVKNGGTIVLVGMAPQDCIEYNFAKIMAKEATIKSVFRYRNIYAQAINAIAAGIIDVSGIITHEFDFLKTEEAFNYVIENTMDVVKAVIAL